MKINLFKTLLSVEFIIIGLNFSIPFFKDSTCDPYESEKELQLLAVCKLSSVPTQIIKMPTKKNCSVELYARVFGELDSIMVGLSDFFPGFSWQSFLADSNYMNVDYYINEKYSLPYDQKS